MGSAAANNASTATVDNSDNSDNSSAWSDGWGTAAANNGATATNSVSVNDSALTGTVTGNYVDFHHFDGEAAMTTSNNMTNTFNGTAGVNQNIQNLGHNALTQQQISFQGNVNVTP